jgi:hypothetical protein
MKRPYEGTIAAKVATMMFVVASTGVAELLWLDLQRERYLRDRRSRLW